MLCCLNNLVDVMQMILYNVCLCSAETSMLGVLRNHCNACLHVVCRVFYLCVAYMAACVVQHDANGATSAVVLLFVVCPVLARIVASSSSCIIM